MKTRAFCYIEHLTIFILEINFIFETTKRMKCDVSRRHASWNTLISAARSGGKLLSLQLVAVSKAKTLEV